MALSGSGISMLKSLPANHANFSASLNATKSMPRALAALLLGATTVALSACAGIDKLKALEAADGYDLPAVENPAMAATIRVRSNDNPSDVQFLHLLQVNGETIMKLGEGDRREFQLDEGDYQISVTCHVVPDPKISSFPVNLSVIDGRDEIELIVGEGDKTCLLVSKPLLTCARVVQSAATVCN